MKKEKFDNKIEKGDSYNISASYQKDNYVHIPVVMKKKENIPDINIDIVDRIMSAIEKKYSGIIMTGEWRTISSEDGSGIKEYLLGYKTLKE